jgi:hypothetical protein
LGLGCGEKAAIRNLNSDGPVMGEARVRTKTQRTFFLATALVVASLSACERNKLPLTECIGDVPAVPRVQDVAPPNCPSG